FSAPERSSVGISRTSRITVRCSVGGGVFLSVSNPAAAMYVGRKGIRSKEQEWTADDADRADGRRCSARRFPDSHQPGVFVQFAVIHVLSARSASSVVYSRETD